jgi:hypothetical protein
MIWQEAGLGRRATGPVPSARPYTYASQPNKSGATACCLLVGSSSLSEFYAHGFDELVNGGL